MPFYDKNIIVGVVFNNTWGWYITDKEIWFLDSEKLRTASEKAGFPRLEYPADEDESIIINEKNAQEFLNSIKEHLISRDDLNRMVSTRLGLIQSHADKINGVEEYDYKGIDKNDLESYYYHADDMLDFNPSLYVNFDDRILYSYYPEPASYEQYVPDGWVGEYRDFEDIVPVSEAYWLDENGGNLLEKAFEEG